MKRFIVLSVALAGSLLLSSAAQAGCNQDNLSCTKVKDEVEAAEETIDLGGYAGLGATLQNDCTIKTKSKMLCHGACDSPTVGPDGSVTIIKPLLCYKAKCVDNPAAGPLLLTDRLGDHSVTRKSTSLVCVPACKRATSSCNTSAECCSASCMAGVCD